jgi:hypothetical protein
LSGSFQINLEKLKQAAKEMRKAQKGKKKFVSTAEQALVEESARASGLGRQLPDVDDSFAICDMVAPVYR